VQPIEEALVLVLAVVVCGFAARPSWNQVPAPLLQIAAGTGLAALGVELPLDSELFFLLFIPPLLFLDGWRIPKGALFSDAWPILTLAIGLVLFTVLGMGYFIDWLIPPVPLAVAFALGAILSPTDPVAVSAIVAGKPMPPRLLHILEGEALLNDASGLVCFRFAVAAVVTGHFSVGAAALSFLQAAGWGLAVGVGVAGSVGLINRWLVARVGEEPGLQILISLLVPFAAYLGAEELHGSGVLAAAAAGVAMHYADLFGRPLAATRTQRRAVWDTVQLTLNGVIFVLLGAQLPATIASLETVAREVGVGSAWKLPLYVVAIAAGLTVLRFVWVLVSMTLLLSRRGRGAGERRWPGLRLVLVGTFAGVRGALTLAGILTLPLALPTGARFPTRDLVIFLSVGVILVSLLAASAALPALTRGLVFAPPGPRSIEEGDARAAAAAAAIERLQEVCNALPREAPRRQARVDAATVLIEAYRRRTAEGERADGDQAQRSRAAEVERELRLEALRAERDALFRRRMSGELSDALHLELLHELDLSEAALG
jgi:monovalent cation/hydrogen antiporter